MRTLLTETDDTPQRFPLQRLLRAVVDTLPAAAESFEIYRAAGHGVRVNELAARAEESQTVRLSFEELFGLTRGVEEWFYDIDIRLADVPASVEIGGGGPFIPDRKIGVRTEGDRR